MNEYNLPIWYVRVFEIICDYQQAENEEASCISGVLIGYLKALVDAGDYHRKTVLQYFLSFDGGTMNNLKLILIGLFIFVL